MILAILLSTSVSAHAVNLDGALRSALERNETAAQSSEAVLQAKERVRQVRSGPLPTLAVEATHLIQPRPKDPIARDFFPERQTTADLKLSQPLFRGFREFAGLRQAGNLLESQEQIRLSEYLKLYENVATNYLQILSLEADLKNLQDLLGTHGQRVKELQGRSRRGESERNEALTARAIEASTDAEIRFVQAQLRSARQAFTYWTGLPADTALTDENPQNDLVLKPLEYYLRRVEERPDIKSAKEKLGAFKEEIKIAKGTYWPSIDGVGRYYFKRPDGFMQDLDWDVQVIANWPLFEGGLRSAQVREATSKHRESELELSRLRRLAASDIRALHENLRLRAEQLGALKKSTDLSQQSYQFLQKNYRRGLTRNVDVQLALTDSGISRRAYDQARFAARLDRIRLETACAEYPSAIVSALK